MIFNSNLMMNLMIAMILYISIRLTNMSQQHANGNLSDISTLAAHIRPCDYLQIALVLYHPAVIIDT